MAAFKKEPDYKQQKNKSSIGKNNKWLIAAAAVIVILLAVYLVYSNVGASAISTPATANLTSQGTVFSINSQQYLISFAGAATGTSKAYVHISKLPVFENPLLNVTLTLGNITKVNAGTTYANIGIELAAVAHNSITIKVTSIATSLDVDPDSQYISVISGTLYTSGKVASSSTTIAQNSISNGTTTTTKTTTGSSTSTSTSTTIKATNTTSLEINSTLKKNYTYSLLLNFSKLYANSTNCTPTLYNSTYVKKYGTIPSGPNTYENVSVIVPYGMVQTTSSAGGTDYFVNFTTRATSSLYDNKTAVTLKLDPASGEMVSQSINSSGIFEGQSVSQMGQDYIAAVGEGVCGVEV
jgi:hypothetical protein